MKKQTASRSAFFNPRLLITVVICAFCVLVAMLASRASQDNESTAAGHDPNMLKGVVQESTELSSVAAQDLAPETTTDPDGTCFLFWTAAPNVPTPLLDTAVVGVGSNLYSFGGVIAGAISASSFKFDGTSWTSIAPLPAAVEFPAAVTDGTDCYILGGALVGTGTPQTSVFKYNVASNTYTTLASFTTGTWNHAAQYFNGKIYKFAGTGPATNSTNVLEIYDVASNTWTVGAPYPLSTSFVGSFVSGGFIYGTGGITAPGSIAQLKTFRFDPTTAVWDDASIADLPDTRWGAASGFFNGTGVLAGGYVAGTATANISTTAIAWTPGNPGSWSSIPSMTNERSRMGGGIAGGAFYAVGGRSIASPAFAGTAEVQKLNCSSTTPTPSPTPCPASFTENFDTVTAPALPPGWLATNVIGAPPMWLTSPTTPDTAPNAAFINDVDIVTDKVLDSPGIAITSPAATVTFKNFFNTESTFDGGVLEISSPNIAGGAFTDITNAAVGGSFVTGGYTGPISTAFSSPIGGRQAWSGNSATYISTVANLGPNVSGQTIKLRFRMATDSSVSAVGWRVDTISIVNGSCGGPTPTPGTPTPTPGTPTPTPTPGTPTPTPGTPTPTPCTEGAVITQGFEDITTLVPAGWFMQNNSQPGPGSTGWFQGNDTVFPAQAGPSTSYIGTNFNNGTGTSTLSNWLLTPPLSLSNGTVLKFWTRTTDTPTFPDRLQVRMSTNGASTNVGATATSVGDFTAILLDINPTYTTSGYPNVWTEFTVNVTGVPSPTTGRLALRYFVENGGPSGVNSDYIGIDTLTVTTGGGCSPTPTPGTPTPTGTPCPPAWSAGAPMPPVAVVRAVGAYFPANGFFYAVGGRSADVAAADFTNPFEYNPATNAWATKVAAYPDNKVNNMACATLTVGGTPQIYCVGGSASQVVGTTGRVFSYNPVTDAITTLTAADDWPGANAGGFLPGGFAVANNQLFIIGSFNANAVPPVVTAEVWRFDPNAAVGSRWVARNPMPVARAYVPAATIGGIIYTAGGSNLDAGGLLIDTTESFKYDPTSGVWTAIASIPRATGETRALVMNNQMWVMGGGRVLPNPGNQVDVYDPVGNTWSAGPAFGAGRRNFATDSDGTTRIWIGGGYDATGLLVNTVERFGPGACATPTPGTPTPTPGTPTPTPGTPTPTPGTPTPTPGSPTPTQTPCPACTPTPTPGSPTPTPGPSGTPTATPTPTPTGPAQAQNLSTRLLVGTGDNVGIGGFIVTGTGPVRVLLRAIGPSLTAVGVPNPLADPVLELHGPGGFVTITNNNWRDNQEAEIEATGIPPTNDLESAIVGNLNPGAYTAIMSGNGGGVGVALVEIYDLSDQAATAKLGNISTRAFVNTGDNVVIAGFILGGGPEVDPIILRGIGPSLGAAGLDPVLADPTLELRNSDGAVVATNNNWQDDPAQAALITAAGLALTNPAESGIAATLPPGAYTAILAGADGGTGLGLVEAYDNPVASPTPTPGPTGTPSPTPGPTGTPGPTPTPGATPTPGSTPTPTPGPPCTEAFDGVTAPALPAGWVASNPEPGDGVLWTTSMSPADTAPNSAFIPDQDGVSDKVLDSRPVTVGSAAATLTFRNYYNSEVSDGVFWDGGVLEVSTPNISAGDFLDITDSHVGGTITTGGYTGEISGDASNPLAGRLAWSGDSGGFINTVITLGPNLAGQVCTFRFRFGTDEAVLAPGWNIDGIVFTDASCQ